MSFLVAPPGQRNGDTPEGGDVDQLLRAFYRAEMPNPWPAFRMPAEAPPVLPFPAAPVRRTFVSRSRLALAASVALLVGGLWALSGKFGGDAPRPDTFRTGPGSANGTGPGVSPKLNGPFLEGDELKVIIEEPAGPGR
jgi:hypothetical protein